MSQVFEKLGKMSQFCQLQLIGALRVKTLTYIVFTPSITYIRLVSLFAVHRKTSADPDQTLQNAASNQGVQCLLTMFH